MARFRLSLSPQAELEPMPATTAERWGKRGRGLYAALLAAGMRKVAPEPDGPTTRDRANLSRGIRSFHLTHARAHGAKRAHRCGPEGRATVTARGAKAARFGA